MRLLFLAPAAAFLLACSSDGPDLDPPADGSTTTTAATTGAGGQGTGGEGAGGEGGADTWGPDQCAPPPEGVPVGFGVGDQLAEIVVKDCDGQDFSLTELCGARGLFIFAAHGWCPLCQSVSGQQEALQDKYAGQGLASVNIVVETAAGQPPDAAYCKLWRDQLGHEDVITLHDPSGASLALWPGGSSSLSAFVDRDRVIVSKLVHTSDIAAIEAGIQGALAP